MTTGVKMLSDLQRALAVNVRRLRAAKGYTLHQLQGRSGLHWRHIQKVCAEEVNVTLQTVCQLARALGTTPVELLWSQATSEAIAKPGVPRKSRSCSAEGAAESPMAVECCGAVVGCLGSTKRRAGRR